MSKAAMAVVLATTLWPYPLSAEPLDEVRVLSVPYEVTSESLSQGVSILSGYELDRKREGTIGESLSGLPGVSSTSFGPGASRPIIRGQSGERVRILIGGIGSFDASTVSPDHAVASDSLSVEKIEVIRGSSTLLYGPSAIGGVVNILDGRIPTKLPEGGLSGGARGLYSSNADERAVAGSLTASVDDHMAIHVDGSLRKASDYRVPQGALVSGETRVSDSAVDAKAGSFGFSKFGDFGFLGASVSAQESDYGVPSDSGEEAPIKIDLDQIRVDLMGTVNATILGFKHAKIRFGWGDYKHKELEGGETGTIFTNKGWEARLDLVQDDAGALSGAIGIQIKRRDFEALGEEAFTPPSETLEVGLFAAEEYESRALVFQGGLRFDHVNVEAEGTDRDFDLIGLSTGVIWSASDQVSHSLNLSRTERGPSAEELFSDGAHLATRSFERGDPSLGKEVAYSAEYGLHIHQERLSFEGYLYYTAYQDYIFQADTGLTLDGLPERLYAQRGADFWGFELETRYRLSDNLSIRAQLDRVRARLDQDGGPLPRIPPFSVGGGVDYSADGLDAGVEVTFNDDQSRVAGFETPTSDYVFVNASVRWCPWGDKKSVCVSLRAKNLFNAVGRNHASFLKTTAPLPGRDIRVTLGASF